MAGAAARLAVPLLHVLRPQELSQVLRVGGSLFLVLVGPLLGIVFCLVCCLQHVPQLQLQRQGTARLSSGA